MDFLESLRNLSITFGIMILLPVVVHLGNKVFLNEPKRMPDQTYEQYTKEHAPFDEYQFYVNLSIGTLFIILGTFVPINFLATGFIFGGIFCIINGYANAWNVIHDIAKFLSLLVILGLLILSAIKIFHRKK